MLKIIYIEDHRRPERNLEYKDTIRKLGLESVIEYCDCVEVDHISNLEADGVICHAGMAGYDVVKFFAQKKEWPLLSYSGAVDSTPNLRENKYSKNHFSVDSDYFEHVLPEFIERCKVIKKGS